MSLSGGPIYHFRALRYRRRLWESHRLWWKQILASVQPKNSSLLLFGPSAGYFLPEEFLGQYKEVRGLEPDALSRKIFDWRFSQKIRWIPTESIADSLSAVQKDFDSDLLFCNVLGQLKFHEPVRKWLAPIQEILQNSHWMSFHDRYSWSGPPVKYSETRPPLFESDFTDWLSRLSNEQGFEPKNILNHETDEVFLGMVSSARYDVWSVLPNQQNLIEFVQKE